MAKILYTKPALTYEQQLQQLKARGMAVENDQRALHLLENISYYRLSGYWYPLLADKAKHIFKQGASFDTTFQLYCFDKELRKLVISELEKIEIAIRAKMIYILAHKYGAFWFLDPSLFKNPVDHANSIITISREYNRSDEQFIHAFKNKYENVLPPCWMIMELSSFGALSMLYKNLLPSMEKRAIAHFFGISDSVFETWLHSIVYLRNVCAHHTRLWNRNMKISPAFPRSPSNLWLRNTAIDTKKIYFSLSMIRYLLQTVGPGNTFNQKIKNLLAQYPNVDPKAMGFPNAWEKEPIWEIV